MFTTTSIQTSNPLWQPRRSQIDVLIDPPASPESVVSRIASIQGPVDVYCWYEGPRGLPPLGAAFMMESLLAPLYAQKRDAKVWLYSLKGWDFHKTVSQMPASTPLGEAINRINRSAVEAIYASSFFRFCEKNENLYSFLSEALPQKKWAFELSEKKNETGIKISQLFDNRPSLFDSVADYDVSKAYSLMQYVEGYYLIRESVKKRLSCGEKKVNIVFALPNDEGKYYRDLPEDLERMLHADFGTAFSDLEITVSFLFFEYGKSMTERPYIGKGEVKPKDIEKYLDYLSLNTRIPFLRDEIHYLHG